MKIKIIIIISVILLASPAATLAYGPNSSSPTAPEVINLPQVNPNLLFQIWQSVVNYLNSSFSSGGQFQLPNLPNITPSPNLQSLNFGSSGGVLNQLVGIVTRIIQIMINIITPFVRQILPMMPAIPTSQPSK